MKRILVAGPDNGMEFGWFLMRWQAKVRYLSLHYDKTYVITTPDRMFAFKDFAQPYEEMASDFRQNMWRFDGCEVDYFRPERSICRSHGNDKFIKFDIDHYWDTPCVAVHMRKKNDGREWGIQKWKKFISGLQKITDLPIRFMGNYEQTHTVPNGHFDHTRAVPLQTICNARLCIGSSSGPMHLASLCGTPHLVWTDNKRWNLGGIKGTNRERYEVCWNPLKTKVEVIDSHGWNPPVEIILEKAKEMLSA